MSYEPVPSSEEKKNIPDNGRYNTFPKSGNSDKFERTLLNPFRERRVTVYFQIMGVFAFIILVALAKYSLSHSYSDSHGSDILVTLRPNFIFVLADDVGWNSFGYEDYDLSFATPYMTAMANNGIIMTNYYSQEVCTPARASLMTGRYPFKVGMQFGSVEAAGQFSLPIEETILPQVLKEMGGYTNYIIGKWNLGHEYAKYLPTARGFDYFLGFLDGHNYYWSKKNPIEPDYTDFMYANSKCYNLYDGSDKETYATTLYSTKAVNVIKAHDYKAAPMFLYFPTQAGHDPFNDADGAYSTGITEDLVGSDRYAQVSEKVVGVKRQQYAMQLMLLDDAVHAMYEAINAVGQLENTYFIVTSDNGGCYDTGGKNGPLRGSKGSLYEGGTKVDAFVYSPQLSKYAGTSYSGLMHVSDWFPTMLSWSNLKFTPTPGFELDGFDQSQAMKGEKINTRETMVYNIYTNVDNEEFDIYATANVAVRNKQYKLIHGYTDNYPSEWYTASEIADSDDDLEYDGKNACGQTQSMEGTFGMMMFDLVNDPYETTDLFNNPAYDSVKTELYALLEQTSASTIQEAYTVGISAGSFTYWKSNDNFVQPFSFDSDDKSSPSRCDATHILSPT